MLRSGGEYQPEHVRWLHRQVPPRYDVVCLSDCDIKDTETVGLRSCWPGWFAKLELFDPELIEDDILYMDLDTVICGDISELTEQPDLMALNDFYFPRYAATGIMYIPHRQKACVWEKIISHRHNIQRFRGDGEFLRTICHFKRWQDIYPGYFVSYKAHIAGRGMPGYHSSRSEGNGSIPPTAKVISFHGNPRPWKLTLPWIPPFP